jgi:cytochrome c5
MDRPTLILRVMLIALVTGGGATLSAQAAAQDASRPFTISPAYRFTETSGEALYNATCAGCHMPDGKGAVGAGHYRRSLTIRRSEQHPTSSSTYCMAERGCHRLTTR